MSLPQPSATTAPAPTAETILQRLLWVPVNVVQAMLVTLWTSGAISLTLPVCALSRSKTLGLTLARRVWAPVLLLFGPVRLEVTGRDRLDPAKAYFVVANHQSWVDIPALFAALPVPLLFLAKRELSRIPFLGSYMEAMGMVYVDRGDRGKTVGTVNLAVERLRQGFSILSFPEGTRSADGRIRPFKTATFAAALEAGVPVVPVALEGPDRIFPKGGFRARSGTLRVALGEPIDTTGLGREDRAEVARKAQQAVETLLAGLRSHTPG